MNPQDVVDASSHIEVFSTEAIPSLLTIIIDTNPRAWAALSDVLPLSRAIANILVFVDAHLACSNSNQVAIIASHHDRAAFLYPAPPKPPLASSSEDIEMSDAPSTRTNPGHAANKYAPFSHIESTLLSSLRALIDNTSPASLTGSTTTQVSGALSLALAYINRTALSFSGGSALTSTAPSTTTTATSLLGLHARILIVSVSESSPAQYIPLMNSVFAASHARIGIDTLALRGKAIFLQQASHITRGTFIQAEDPRGIMQYLMFGLAAGCMPRTPGQFSSEEKKKGVGKASQQGTAPLASVADLLNSPSAETVDFRAACFCHRRVVDTGYVCSVCLSIFCEVPEEAECLTCGTKLQLGSYGKKPVVKFRGKVVSNGA